MFVPEGIIHLVPVGKMAKWFRVYPTQSLDNMLTGTCAVSKWPSHFPKIINSLYFQFLLYFYFIKINLF